jgi:hypothetical protein
MRFYSTKTSQQQLEPKTATYCFGLLEEHLVIFAESGAEDDARDALETMYPLLALRALSTDVEHMYPARWGSRSQNRA